jgi:hypothetical protein
MPRSRCASLSLSALLLTCALASPMLLAAPPGCTQSVGSGADCDHSNLASALLAAAFSTAPSTLCLSGSFSNVDFDLVNFDQGGTGLTVRGGYASCSSNSASGYSVLTGDGADPAFDIRAGAGRASLVRLERVSILSAAPAVRAGAGARVTLVNSILERNVRGIEATAGAVVSLDSQSEVVDNTHPTDGAGILCEGSRVDIAGVVAGNALSSSSANNRGGGLKATDCGVNLLEGGWFAGNRAPSGAGLWLFNSIVRGGGTGALGVRIVDNQSNGPVGSPGSGAAIVAAGGADVLLANTRIEGNAGPSILVLTSGARVQLERFNFETCAVPPRCATLSDNDATALVRVQSDSTFRMMQGFVEGNRGAGTGVNPSLFEASATSARVELDGIQIHGNRVDAIFDVRGGGESRAGFLSVARNGPNLSSPSVTMVLGGGPGSVSLFSSILQDQGGFIGTLTALDCVIGNTLVGATATRSITSNDPGFVNAVGGDLHLRPDSIAIDYCDSSAYAPLDTDFDLDARGQDDPRNDRFGRFDIGADERPPGSPPPDGPIFSDGFED